MIYIQKEQHIKNRNRKGWAKGMVFQDYELWRTNLILYCHNQQGTTQILDFTGIQLYGLFAKKWVIGWRSKIFRNMMKTFTMKYLYQDSICLSEIRIAEKSNRKLARRPGFRVPLCHYCPKLRLGTWTTAQPPTGAPCLEADGSFATLPCPPGQHSDHSSPWWRLGPRGQNSSRGWQGTKWAF